MSDREPCLTCKSGRKEKVENREAKYNLSRFAHLFHIADV